MSVVACVFKRGFLVAFLLGIKALSANSWDDSVDIYPNDCIVALTEPGLSQSKALENALNSFHATYLLNDSRKALVDLRMLSAQVFIIEADLKRYQMRERQRLAKRKKFFERRFDYWERLFKLNEPLAFKSDKLDPLEKRIYSAGLYHSQALKLRNDIQSKIEMTRSSLFSQNIREQSGTFTEQAGGGIAIIWNERFNRLETKSLAETGVAGKYNPMKERVEWITESRSGVAIVFNPATKEYETKKEYKYGIAGVYNPETQKIEWKASRRTGVAGVYNPILKKIEWNENSRGAILGIFDPHLGEVIWETKDGYGMALYLPHAEPGSYTTQSWYGHYR